MQIDPQAEISLKLSDDGKAYSFKPWSYRQSRAWIALQQRQDITLRDFEEQAYIKLAEGYNGDADELQDLTFKEILELLVKRHNACYVSPEDKKKSES